MLLLERVLLDAALALQVALPELEVEVLGFTVALELAAFLVELLSLGEPVGVHLLLALFQDFFSLRRGALGVLDLTRDGLVHRLGVRLDRLGLFGNLGLGGLRRFAPLALLRVSRSLGLGRLFLSLGFGVGGGLGRRLARSLGFLLRRPLLLLQLVHDGALGGSFLLELAFRALGGVSLGLVRSRLGLCDFLGASLEPSLGGGGFVLRGTIREPELLGVRLELRLNDEAVLVEQLRPGRAGFLSRRILPGCPFPIWLFSFGRRGIRGLGRGRGLLDRVALRVLGHRPLSIALKISVPRAFIHDGVSAGGAASASATFLATAALRSASAAERLSARSAASRCRSTRLASFSSGVNGGGSDAVRTRRRRRSLTISR